MKNKKIALLLASVLAISTMLTGCGGGSDSGSSSGTAHPKNFRTVRTFTAILP